MYKSNVKSYSFIDLFAGIGGIRTAFERQGYDCVLSSEIDSDCRDIYYKNYGEIPFGDVRELSSNSIGKYDVLTAGFPCQPFSICGRKRGFEDTRGTLFFEICRIIKDTNPEVVCLENVKHLLHHDSGRTLELILSSLEDLGYITTYKVLNAINFGVPQNRERIIIIGSKKCEFNFSKLKTTPNVAKLVDFLEQSGDFEYLRPEEYTFIEKPTTQPTGLIFCGYRNKGIWKKGIRPNTEHLSRVHRQPNRIYSVMGTHPTIPSQETSGRFFIYIPQENAVRKLTIKECYKIMGFDYDFKISSNRGNAYKQVGNSVCIPMIEEISKEIRAQLLELNESIYEPRRKINRVVQQELAL